MGSDLWSWLAGNQQLRNKALKKTVKVTAKVASKTLPIAKTVQAGHSVYKLGSLATNVNGAAQSLNDFIPKASGAAEALGEFVPSIQVMGQSLCDSVKIFTRFNAIATTAGIAANLVLTYQGVQALKLIAARLQDVAKTLQAQTAILSQQHFPGYVYKLVGERLGVTADDPDWDHWFFLYHPDNDWYPEFYHLLEKNPLGRRFCAYTNQIDTVFAFMLAARQRRNERERRARERRETIRPVKFHLLIPAYQPIVVTEPLQIPIEIGSFVIEGRINSGTELVWLNLPESQRGYVLNVGQFVPPPQGWWDWAQERVGLGKEPSAERRFLGSRQQPQTDGDQVNDQVSDSNDEGEAPDTVVHPVHRERNRHDATPLHQQRSRQQRRRHGRSSSSRD